MTGFEEHRHGARCAPVALRALAVALALLGATVGGTVRAVAGGYDLPTTYSARHVGMGGAAVAAVADPSAIVHNPAGLGHVRRISVLGDLSLMLGRIQGAPEEDVAARSQLAVAPLFLVGGAFRLTDWLVAGIAVSPVAAAGAEYAYASALGRTEDRTSALFLEISPGIAFDLPWGLRIGAGYRVTVVRMNRYKKGAEASGPGIDLALAGVSFAGFRVGVQWQPIDDREGAPAWDRRRLHVGLAYRHRVTVDVSAGSGVALSQRVTDLASGFVLPSKLSFGVRGDLGRFGAAFDLEVGFNSQNDEGVIRADLDGIELRVPNVFRWTDAVTARGGLEARLLEAGQLALRAGYVFDGATATRGYPTAFGPPPAPTHAVTFGAGYDFGALEANLAYAFRFGGATVVEEDLDGGDLCPFCGFAGDYAVRMHGVFVDVSYDFE